jgi:hypothetical protein
LSSLELLVFLEDSLVPLTGTRTGTGTGTGTGLKRTEDSHLLFMLV